MMKKFLTAALAVACMISAASIGVADVIVQWGAPDPFESDIVTSTTNYVAVTSTFDGTVSNPDVGNTVPYYPNNTGRTPVFSVAASDVQANLTAAQIQQPGNNQDRLRLVDSIAPAGTMQLMYVWGDAVTGSNFLTSDDVLESFSLTGFGSAGNTTQTLRMIFQEEGGDWLASADLGLSGGNSDRNIADVTAVDWFGFTPITAGTGVVLAQDLTPNFTNFQNVGFYYTNTNNDVAAATLGSQFSYFQVTANPSQAIPEPGSFALMGLLGIAGLARRRRA